jgi:thiosulfate sulfurtransferase
MTYKCISVDQANELILGGDVTILDIRDPQSFLLGHIENAINVLNSNVDELVRDGVKSRPLIIYCYHGNSSKSAAEYFYHQGFEASFSVDGGFEEWKRRL